MLAGRNADYTIGERSLLKTQVGLRHEGWEGRLRVSIIKLSVGKSRENTRFDISAVQKAFGTSTVQLPKPVFNYFTRWYMTTLHETAFCAARIIIGAQEMSRDKQFFTFVACDIRCASRRLTIPDNDL